MAKSIANQLSPSQVLGRAATLLRLLEEEGLPYEAWQIPIDDTAKRQLLVRYWRAGLPALYDFEETLPAKTAGVVWDARSVNELFSLGYTEEQLMDFGPPPDAMPGFLTFFDPGWDLLRLREFCDGKGQIFHRQNWYDLETFAMTGRKSRYCQLRLEAVRGSFNKTFDDQRRLLPVTEEVPFARAVVMGMVIHFLGSGGLRLFERCFVRCADKNSDGDRVFVGDFGSDGFVVDNCWDGHRHDGLGLASSRKL